MEGRRLKKKKKSSGNIFCIVRKWAGLRLCFNSAWSGSSSHRWWTNVLLKERCTRLGSCTAQQRASFAADGLKSSHQQTRSWQAWLLPSIHWRVGYMFFGIFHFVCGRALAKSFYPLIGIDQSSFDMALLIVNESVSLFQHHHPKLNCRSCCYILWGLHMLYIYSFRINLRSV